MSLAIPNVTWPPNWNEVATGKAPPLSKEPKNKPKWADSVPADVVQVGTHLFNCSASELTGEHIAFVSDALSRMKDLMKPYTESELVTPREEYAYLVAVLSD